MRGLNDQDHPDLAPKSRCDVIALLRVISPKAGRRAVFDRAVSTGCSLDAKDQHDCSPDPTKRA
ncbi:hypothetical protein N136_00092 [Leifsonia aquatica ATCC 14665]|uniref:Uncharacterized protein n=1 Tax=Leifsonia aquatica ATCC 14665 TaxID=1358026 RepID=U2RYF2_LEIAQ|nr:hypothetical protein N136_00092 [Leifsonia aquatica ATCC 14665]